MATQLESPSPYAGSAPVTAAPTTPEPAVLRLLDANLDRSREGLRVLEDWCRFGLDRQDLVARLKDLRQRLGRCHLPAYKAARHTASDGGAGLAHPAQAERTQPAQVVAANAGRAQEALRVLEEFGRASDPLLASEAAAIRYALYDLELDLMRACGAAAGRREQLLRCHLYLITTPSTHLLETVAAALDAGVRLVQYRAKESADVDRWQEARALRQLCSRHGALFIINDRVDLAMAVEADGVHLGQGDLPPAEARRLLGPDRLIGRSTHRIEQLRQAVADGCDYVGVGPINATPTKPGREPVGLAYVRQAAAESPIPFFAIGGIDATTLAPVQAAGGRRVAVVRAIIEASDPGAASLELLKTLGEEA
ncbi:thiamine phosphate synthase [Synechococcus sp. Cruz-9H2]|nr:thiamine phosphate synthase [Synechococcus sp. Cruz-9H2]MCP9843734.1 thiamine phosphate synthase [Synechococcus sp. Edmonson 11F2]MCP9855547.1 thiamine phosphate synthase [Synechococcus sp. Cruz-9C9]MCP9862985.1 thiamine phosphate synthase [Synechococcus sp. Cruz-7E5]MCP9870140.1 thiamine phosphate synthase [Synechococcus sp. Cruz-7B9]